MLKRIRKYFLTGLAVFLPIVFTALFLQYVLRFADRILADPLYKALPLQLDKHIAIFTIKILILVIVFLFICLIGLGTEIFVVKSFFNFVESMVKRVPMVNRIYGTIKEIFSAFVGQEREIFRSAVLIEYPRKGLYSIAFITRTSHPKLKKTIEQDLVSVFLPTTPNPTSGLLLFLPKNEAIALPFSVEEAIKMVVSGGALTQDPAALLEQKE